jgi:hypothetical protein
MRLDKNLGYKIERHEANSGIYLQVAFFFRYKFLSKPIGLLPILANNVGKIFGNSIKLLPQIFPSSLPKLAPQRIFNNL